MPSVTPHADITKIADHDQQTTTAKENPAIANKTTASSTENRFFPNLLARINGYLDALFEPARTANALGNGAISAGAIKSNAGLLILGLVTGMVNSYAAGEARETSKIQNVPPALWWTDRIIALIYGIGCGATTAASAYQVFTSLSLVLGGVWGLVGFGALIGIITLIASYKKLGFINALLLSCAITACYVAIGFILLTFASPALLAPILLVSTYFLSATLGFSTTILNYGITQDSIISLVMSFFVADKTTQTKTSISSLTKTAKEKTNYIILLSIAALSCTASGFAIGGLTYISIMALPTAFGFAMPVAALLSLAAIIAAVTTFAMIPLLIKQCIPIAEEWSKVSLIEIPGIIKKQLSDLFIFNPEIYQDTLANRTRFYLKAVLLTLIIPIAVTGSVLTMLQASEALSDVIKNIIQSLAITLKAKDDNLAENLAYATLGGALISDLIFSITTVFAWMSRVSSKVEEKVKTESILPTTADTSSVLSIASPAVPALTAKPELTQLAAGCALTAAGSPSPAPKTLTTGASGFWTAPRPRTTTTINSGDAPSSEERIPLNKGASAAAAR